MLAHVKMVKLYIGRDIRLLMMVVTREPDQDKTKILEDIGKQIASNSKSLQNLSTNLTHVPEEQQRSLTELITENKYFKRCSRSDVRF